MGRGYFISIEGPDGSGKTTQIRAIESFLKERGIAYICTREPGGTDISEKIRELILDRDNSEMTAETEVLLYASARAQLVRELIEPSLAAGKTVLCDRFTDSSVAYQGFGRGIGAEEVEAVNRFATGGLTPDLTFLLKLEPETASRRIEKGEEDRIELETLEFHRRVYEGYLELERRYPKRIVGIDARGSAEEISSRILAVLGERLG